MALVRVSEDRVFATAIDLVVARAESAADEKEAAETAESDVLAGEEVAEGGKAGGDDGAIGFNVRPDKVFGGGVWK